MNAIRSGKKTTARGTTIRDVGGVARARRARSKDRRARAAAIVEFAVVLPLLMTILFGIIEYGWVFMVRQTMQNAAREGCRQAVLQTTTEPYTSVTQRVNDIMGTTGMTTFAITMDHADDESCMETVTVTIPYDDVAIVGFFPSKEGSLTASASMRKEGCGVEDD